jgi:hypothetical protein
MYLFSLAFSTQFFTTYGVEKFVEAVALSGRPFSFNDEDGAEGEDGAWAAQNLENRMLVSRDLNNNQEGGGEGFQSQITSTCTNADGHDHRELNENREGGGNKDSTSYGLSCDGRDFVQSKFNGAYCVSGNEAEIMNTLPSFNSQMQQVDCLQIYSWKDLGSYSYTLSGAEDNAADADEHNGGENEGQEGMYSYLNIQGDDGYKVSQPVDLLKYSRTCYLSDSVDCPNPYGRVAKYEMYLDYAHTQPDRLAATLRFERRIVPILSPFLLVCALIFVYMSYRICKRAGVFQSSEEKDVESSNIDGDHAVGAFTASGVVRTVSDISAVVKKKTIKVVDRIRDYAEEEEQDDEERSEPLEEYAYSGVDESGSNKRSCAVEDSGKDKTETDGIGMDASGTKDDGSMWSAVMAHVSSFTNAVTAQAENETSGDGEQNANKVGAAADAYDSAADANIATSRYQNMDGAGDNSAVSGQQTSDQSKYVKATPKYKRPLLGRISKAVFGRFRAKRNQRKSKGTF